MMNIALLDKNKLFRVSLESFIEKLPEVNVVVSVDSLKLVEKSSRHEKIDLIIVDPNSFGNSTIETISKLMVAFPTKKILILSEEVNRRSIGKAVAEGVFAYFSKSDDPIQLMLFLEEINKRINFASEITLSPVVKTYLTQNSTTPLSEEHELSVREIEILELVCNEKTNAEISAILGLSVRTIESHRRRMIDKMDCRNIIGVILEALSNESLKIVRVGRLKHCQRAAISA